VKRDSTTSLLSVKEIKQQEIKIARAIVISTPLLLFGAIDPSIPGDSNWFLVEDFIKF
jgi:hypothetical protein